MTYIATLVERQSRFVIMVKIADKRTEVVVAARIKAVRKLPIALRRSLTWDRGAALANHAQYNCCYRRASIFLRPLEPLVAWEQREHERADTTVLLQRVRSIRSKPSPVRYCSQEIEYATARNPALEDAGAYARH